jgi:hypothetical protein
MPDVGLMYWLDLLKCATEPLAKYSVQITSLVQSVKIPLKPFLGVFKKKLKQRIPIVHL